MKPSALATFALLAATLSLRAESPRFGVQGLLSIPLLDLKDQVDSKLGPGIGVHGTFHLEAGHMVRPRLDYTTYPDVTTATLKRKASDFSLGGDYLYFPAGKPEGLYLTAGMSFVRWTFSGGEGSGLPAHTTKLGLAGGAGYQWNATLGTEVRWLHGRINSQFKADALQLGATIRF